MHERDEAAKAANREFLSAAVGAEQGWPVKSFSLPWADKKTIVDSHNCAEELVLPVDDHEAEFSYMYDGR